MVKQKEFIQCERYLTKGINVGTEDPEEKEILPSNQCTKEATRFFISAYNPPDYVYISDKALCADCANIPDADERSLGIEISRRKWEDPSFSDDEDTTSW